MQIEYIATLLAACWDFEDSGDFDAIDKIKILLYDAVEEMRG